MADVIPPEVVKIGELHRKHPLIKTWNKVNYYRTHLNEISFLKKTVEKRKKFYRLNTKFNLQSDPTGQNILEKKTLFLNDIKLTDEDSDNEQCDFID